MNILVTIVGFILTGVVGNYLVQRWQLRNWLTQQKISSIEKEHSELKKLAEDFSSVANERIFSMRAVLYSLKIRDRQLHKNRIAEYRDALKTWNHKYGYFSAKLPFLMNQTQTRYFDEEVHEKLVAASTLLDKAIAANAGDPSTRPAIEQALSQINGASIRLTNEILQKAKRKQESMYTEMRLPYNIGNIEKYSTWQLIKALFIKEVNSFSVVRSPLEP